MGSSLLQQAADTLAKLESQVLASSQIVVPTLRLGTHLNAALTVRKPATILPKVMTLETFLLDLSFAAGFPSAILCKEDLEILVSEIFREADLPFRPGQIHEICQIYTEILRSGGHLDGFSALERYLEEDVYRGDFALSVMSKRLLAIKEGFLKLKQRLFENAWASRDEAIFFGSQFFLDAARSDEISLKKAMGGCSRFFVVGLSSASAATLPFIEGAGLLSWASFILSQPPPMVGSKLQPLREIWEVAGLKIPPSRKERPHQTEILFSDTRAAMIRTAVRKIDDLLKSGHEPHSLGVLLASEEIDASLLTQELKKRQIGFNDATAKKVSNTAIGIWFEKILRMLEPDAELSHIFEALNHPFTAEYFCGSHPEDWSAFLAKPFAKMAKNRDFGHYRDFLFHLDKNLAPAKESDSFLEDKARKWLDTLKNWESFLSDPLELLKILWGQCAWLKRLKANDNNQFEQVKEHWQNLLNLQTRLGLSCLPPNKNQADLIRQYFLSQSVFGLGEPLEGVQVMSLPEARSYPFRTIFILGAHEGEFPIAHPNDEIFSSREKAVMKLPTWDALEARENQTFELLQAGSEQIYLFLAKEHNGRDLVPSRFVAQSLAEGARFSQAEDSQNDLQEEESALEKTLIRLSHEETEAALQGSSLSASQLERFLRCPFRFYTQNKIGPKLTLTPRQESLQQKEGELLHKIVADALNSAMQVSRGSKPSQKHLYEELCSKTCSRLNERGGAEVLSPFLVKHLLDFSWVKLASFLDKMISLDNFISLSTELSLADSTTSLSLGPKPALAKGAIDLRLTLDKSMIIFDFKRKSVANPGQTVLNPQLLFYSDCSLTTKKEEDLDLGSGYWSLLEGSWQPVSRTLNKALETFWTENLGWRQSKGRDVEARITELKSVIEWRRNEIHHAGGMVPDRSHCSFCDKALLCRKNSTENRSHIQERLLQHLRSQKTSHVEESAP